MIISGRSAKILVIALSVSVLLNLAAAGFIGVVLGNSFSGRAAVSQLVEPVPAELRAAFRSQLWANRRPILSVLSELRRDRESVHAALTAETLDRAALDKANQAVRQDVEKLVTLGQFVLAEAAASLPTEVRRSIPRLTFGGTFMRWLSEPGPPDEAG